MKKTIFILVLFSTFTISLNAQKLKEKWIVCNTQGCKVLDPLGERMMEYGVPNYSVGVTMNWEGACVDGKANGYGKLTRYKDGEYESTFEGEFKNGIREGKGRFSGKDRTVSEGVFVAGQMTGKGSSTQNDGQKYIGDFINYIKHGFGTIEFTNGSKFEGFFVSDIMYTGKYTNYDGVITYKQKYYPVEKINEISSGYKPEIGVRVTEFFDKKWIRCKQKDASFYRLVTYESDNKPKGVVKNFYIRGQLQSEFTAVYLDYDDEGKNFYEGEATWYFENGKIEQKRYYWNNKITGKNTYYFDNGQIAQEANYKIGKYNGLYQQWYKTGKPKITAYYEHGSLVENKYIEYDENGLGALVYKENFRANKDIWEDKNEVSVSKLNEDGNVSLFLNSDNSASRLNYVTLNQNSSYSIESIIQKKSGKGNEGYGIIFGFKDWNNYYKFLISEYSSYIILGKFEGVNIKICEWTKSNAIKVGNKRNLLKVMKFEDEFIFSINGEVVEGPKSKDLRGNNIGITAGGIGEYCLENIIVKEFMSAEELGKKGPKHSASSASEWKGNGSGFFINEKGYIATNYHVVKDASAIQVEYFQKGIKNTFSAEVIVTDKQNDLAIIQINDTKFKHLPSIPYVFSSTIKDVGSEVFALGYPIANVMGDEIKFTDGKISSKTGIKGDITVYQISVPIQPGNSGGPLFDNKGNLVGITSSALNKEYFNSENVNYAIKTTYLKNLIDVMPENITLPNNIDIFNKPLTEKIKLLSDFIPIIRVK
ncbi:MAG: trypsin-like peptidase domain-containing protein [Chitinophagaceae bacterium]|nr:trypsin-like peptidase domain-containing protein [Chitinophagaceae bacterium]